MKVRNWEQTICLPVELSLPPVRVRDGLGELCVDVGLHPDVAPDAYAYGDEGHADDLKKNQAKNG